MHNEKFTVYSGKFFCKTCGEEVKSLRLLKENGNATWMCSNKHLSIVPLIPQKKKKKDYEREV